MSYKEHLSIRIKSSDCDDRINISDWEKFQNMQHYFKKSVPYMIEAALAYEKNVNNKKENVSEINFSNDLEYIDLPNINTSWLRPYLKEGKIYKKIKILKGENVISIPKSYFGVNIKLYKPYILSFETSINTRITLDLTKKIIIDDTNELLKLCVE